MRLIESDPLRRKHAAYWKEQELRQYLGGPFADRSGGPISFETDSDTEAEKLVADDPLLHEALLERLQRSGGAILPPLRWRLKPNYRLFAPSWPERTPSLASGFISSPCWN
jgi:uncharacterized protein YciI